MRKLILLAAAGLLVGPSTLAAQAARNVDLKEWPVEYGGRTRDPYVAPDGKVWFVGQTGNYIATLDPTTGALKRYTIEEGTNPHNLIVAPDGMVWYSGNLNGRIGRLDPATGQAKIYMMPDPAVRDPHTLVFDGKGNIWFTAQGASRVGRLNMATGKIDIINPVPSRTQPAGPYGIVIDKDGRPWFNLFATNLIGTVDPVTLEAKTYPVGQAATRNRRIAMTADGLIYYTDYSRGYLGQLNTQSGQTKEWLMPGGERSAPYAVTADDQGRLWVSETGPEKRLVGFDPKSERFFSINTVSGGIRHMMYHAATGTMWFGTDANQVGRLVARAIIP
jgi:virginiamycin B lyase